MPATTCASVGGGGAAGVSRRCPVVTRVWGRRGGCARRGAMTSIFGSAVLPPPAGAAVCAVAATPRPSSSDAELERRRAVFTESVIIPDPEKAAARFVVNEFEKRLPSMCDGPIAIYPGGNRPRTTRRSLRDDKSIDVRRRGERGAETRRARSSDGRTRHRWSGTGIRPPAAAATAAASRTTACWRAP